MSMRWNDRNVTLTPLASIIARHSVHDRRVLVVCPQTVEATSPSSRTAPRSISSVAESGPAGRVPLNAVPGARRRAGNGAPSRAFHGHVDPLGLAEDPETHEVDLNM